MLKVILGSRYYCPCFTDVITEAQRRILSQTWCPNKVLSLCKGFRAPGVGEVL